MARRVTSLEQAPVDVIEALKRAFIHRGFIPRKYQRNSQLSTAVPAKNTDDNVEAPAQDSQEVSQTSDEQEPAEIHEKLIDITEKAHDVLFKADTVFPFTLFPDTITLDREKLTVANRFFFRTAQVVSVPVSSVLSVEATVGVFFGSISMTSKYFVQNTHAVSFLWHSQAIELQRLLQGFIVAHDKKIDVSEINTEDLCVLLKDLGQGVGD
ncbi:MAG: hypothetical protein ACREGG_05000 [Candidatus Saccharimonadales bacterium]